MKLQFKDRFVTEKGTVYCDLIGNSDKTSDSFLKEKQKEIESLKGQRIIINEKESTVLDSRINRRCNLVNTNYYIEILTDEEFTTSFTI